MMKNEFEQRTGFYPSSAMYHVIEKFYMESDLDKDAFCEAFRKNASGMAERIQLETDEKSFKENLKLDDEIRKRDIEIKCLKEEISRLRGQLERELEWKPYEFPENVSQSDYDKLAKDPDVQKMSDNEAKDLLNQLFGFDKQQITIKRSVPLYEINRHRTLRKVGEAERIPFYFASDMNYIRFDCGMMRYEYFNDQLSFFYA